MSYNFLVFFLGQSEDVVIKWMKLSVGETKKCECGHWFKLVPLEE